MGGLGGLGGFLRVRWFFDLDGGWFGVVGMVWEIRVVWMVLGKKINFLEKNFTQN